MDDIFKCILVNENVWIPIKISLKFVPKRPINIIPAMFQIMAWRRPGDKPLSEAMLVSLPTHICVTRPQWVKSFMFHLHNRMPQMNMDSSVGTLAWPADLLVHLNPAHKLLSVSQATTNITRNVLSMQTLQITNNIFRQTSNYTILLQWVIIDVRCLGVITKRIATSFNQCMTMSFFKDCHWGYLNLQNL